MPQRILVAEDNPEIRLLIKHILSREGYEIEDVDNGEAAIEKISRNDYDAILLDFMMPVASGFDVIDWIDENKPELAKSCVIVLTAALRELQSFDQSKVFAAIAKPFDVMQLREVVRKCVEKS